MHSSLTAEELSAQSRNLAFPIASTDTQSFAPNYPFSHQPQPSFALSVTISCPQILDSLRVCTSSLGEDIGEDSNSSRNRNSGILTRSTDSTRAVSTAEHQFFEHIQESLGRHRCEIEGKNIFISSLELTNSLPMTTRITQVAPKIKMSPSPLEDVFAGLNHRGTNKIDSFVSRDMSKAIVYSISTLLHLRNSPNVGCDISKFSLEAMKDNILKPKQMSRETHNRNIQVSDRSRSRALSSESVDSNDVVLFAGHGVQHPSRQPLGPPKDPLDQKKAGFARFLKEHASPSSHRVTAGGRIVPMNPVVPPPAFDPENVGSNNNEQNGPDTSPVRPSNSGTAEFDVHNTHDPRAAKPPTQGTGPDFDFIPGLEQFHPESIRLATSSGQFTHSPTVTTRPQQFYHPLPPNGHPALQSPLGPMTEFNGYPPYGMHHAQMPLLPSLSPLSVTEPHLQQLELLQQPYGHVPFQRVAHGIDAQIHHPSLLPQPPSDALMTAAQTKLIEEKESSHRQLQQSLKELDQYMAKAGDELQPHIRRIMVNDRRNLIVALDQLRKEVKSLKDPGFLRTASSNLPWQQTTTPQQSWAHSSINAPFFAPNLTCGNIRQHQAHSQAHNQARTLNAQAQPWNPAHTDPALSKSTFIRSETGSSIAGINPGSTGPYDNIPPPPSPCGSVLSLLDPRNIQEENLTREGTPPLSVIQNWGKCIAAVRKGDGKVRIDIDSNGDLTFEPIRAGEIQGTPKHLKAEIMEETSLAAAKAFVPYQPIHGQDSGVGWTSFNNDSQGHSTATGTIRSYLSDTAVNYGQMEFQPHQSPIKELPETPTRKGHELQSSQYMPPPPPPVMAPNVSLGDWIKQGNKTFNETLHSSDNSENSWDLNVMGKHLEIPPMPDLEALKGTEDDELSIKSWGEPRSHDDLGMMPPATPYFYGSPIKKEKHPVMPYEEPAIPTMDATHRRFGNLSEEELNHMAKDYGLDIQELKSIAGSGGRVSQGQNSNYHGSNEGQFLRNMLQLSRFSAGNPMPVPASHMPAKSTNMSPVPRSPVDENKENKTFDFSNVDPLEGWGYGSQTVRMSKTPYSVGAQNFQAHGFVQYDGAAGSLPQTSPKGGSKITGNTQNNETLGGGMSTSPVPIPHFDILKGPRHGLGTLFGLVRDGEQKTMTRNNPNDQPW
ncbi:MAG: hypothetical protein M1834_007598 [Cirrosporium novae-zelandiae]|nr:MAG: hypothetical protein M1834_007598 [Cirrosporium novae-zelandiae]